MPVGSPKPFKEALTARDVKRVMPTSMSSAELAQLEVAVRERAMFSSRTTNQYYLEQIAERVRKILNPVTVRRSEGMKEGQSEFVTEGMDVATARTELKAILREIGYAPDPDEAGTLKDLSSDARLNLVLETNVEMAQGYGYWAQGQDPELLELYPCQELYRAEDRDDPRAWLDDIWPNAARTVGDVGAMAALAQGRMVARKDSPIWVEISDFGQPYPPFKFNSGMDVQDVDREEAIALGVIEGNEVIQPQSRGFEIEPEAGL